MEDAFALIDEVEAGLHPYTQRQLLLEFQRPALRNRLQIIVTTPGPAVLDSVQPEARVFLERAPDNVVLRSTYRNLIQRSLYGRFQTIFSILCLDNLYSAAADRPESIAKNKFSTLAGELSRQASDIMREIGRAQAEGQSGEMYDRLVKLERAIGEWRTAAE
jgi:hypothetical protein